uniref:Uncharacterized protein n=1 Tax=Arundo donax TaxID=35708 RepID=A0A0A9GXF1_ARUDO
MNFAVKEMPNFVGTKAIPRFFQRLFILKLLMALRASTKLQDAFSSSHTELIVQFWSNWP